jgi:ribose/xylose/arabinose/galactoside ABC-type transport system permease subunit
MVAPAQPEAAPDFRAKRSLAARVFSAYGQEIVIALAIVALFVVVSAINPRFLGANNLNTIIAGNAYIAVAAIGMSMIIITGNIDVSVGALIGVLATISGTLAVSGYPVWFAWIAPIFIGAAINGVVGALVAYGRLPSIVVTLGMLSILRGGLVFVTGGAWINNIPPAFQLAQARWLGLPATIWFMVVLTILAFLWMKNTAFGRSLYAIGGNADAARAAGIPVERRIVQVFMIHGAFAGIATMLFATQLRVIQSTVPPNLELTIITASVIGGVSILGGTGTVIGSTLAAILFAAIGSAMIFVNVSAYWLRAVIGFLILVTVLVDMARRNREFRSATR